MNIGRMNIGQAARLSGVSAKMIRYYESIGLGPRPARSDANYRHYDQADIDTLRFIGRARGFGLPIGRIRALVSLWQDRGRASRDVKAIALAHVADLREQAARLGAMADALASLAASCEGDGGPRCPILADLGGTAPDPDPGPWPHLAPGPGPGPRPDPGRATVSLDPPPPSGPDPVPCCSRPVSSSSSRR